MEDWMPEVREFLDEVLYLAAEYGLVLCKVGGEFVIDVVKDSMTDEIEHAKLTADAQAAVEARIKQRRENEQLTIAALQKE